MRRLKSVSFLFRSYLVGLALGCTVGLPLLTVPTGGLPPHERGMLYLAVLAVSFLLGPIFLRLDRTFIAAFLGAVLLPPLVVLAATRGILQSIIPVLLSLLLASRLVVGAVLCSLPFLAAALLLLLCFHRKVMSNLFAICLMAPAFAAATWFFLDAMFLSRLATHGLVFDPGATALSRCCLVYICTAFTAFEFHRMAHST